MPARNTIEIILTATDLASRELSNIGTSMERMGQRLSVAGALIENGLAPVRRGLESALEAAMGFETNMTNAGAVLGKTKDEMKGLSAEVLALGSNSIFGGQQAADAYYDIVSGVQDASTHMAILSAAMDLATAGNANLKVSTNAVIDVMNAYGLKADRAIYVTDVLTQTVGLGKGTMDEFASAMPAVTAIAGQLGVDFHEVGAQMAFLTTKGMSASEAATSLNANMIALMKPNADMKRALEELGVESGEAAIAQWGLDGALKRLAGTQTANERGMAALVGSVEALKGAGYLAGEEFVGFRQKFVSSMDGATAAAKAIQMESLTNKWNLFSSRVEDVAIKVGSIFLPVLTDLADKLLPVLTQVGEWIAANPELTQGILLVVGAMVIAGPILSGLGSLLSVIGGAMAIVNGAVGLGTILMGGLSTAAGVLGGLVSGAATAVAGMGAAMMASIAGILAVAGAVAIAIAKVVEFNNLVGSAGDWAQGEFAGYVEGGGQMTREELDALSFQSAYNEMLAATGSPFLADAFARTSYSNFANTVQGDAVLPPRARGGPVSAGQPYLVGENGPEMMVPGRSGFIVPNGGGGGAPINVYVNAPEGSGRNAALGFGRAIALELRRRGT